MYCSCENCRGYHRHYFLRWFLGVIILLMAFALGVKIGEFKGEISSEFGYGGHHFIRNPYVPMMQYNSTVPAPTRTGTQSTAPTNTKTTK